MAPEGPSNPALERSMADTSARSPRPRGRMAESRSDPASICPLTLGAVARRVETSGIVATETEHGRGTLTPEHAHAASTVGIVLEGARTVVLEDLELLCEPWTMIFLPPAERHRDRIGEDPTRVLRLEIPGDRMDAARRAAPIFDRPSVVGGATVGGIAKRLYSEFRSDDDYSGLALEGLLLDLLAQASRQNHEGTQAELPPWMVRARTLLKERFTESIGLSEIASEVGVHPVHLARTYREHHGETVGEALRKMRIEFAARRLSEGPEPLARIAEEAGFSDQSHFSRLFRQHTGMTPSQFRKASRGF